MKKLPLIAGLVALGSLAGLISRRMRPRPEPEGAWRDLATKPSTNGSHPG